MNNKPQLCLYCSYCGFFNRDVFYMISKNISRFACEQCELENEVLVNWYAAQGVVEPDNKENVI